MSTKKKLFTLAISLLILLNSISCFSADNWRRGIYLTQATAENTPYVQYLINKSKEVGINAFVVDLQSKKTNNYQKNIQLIKQNGIKYVARIVIFPNGGTDDEVLSQSYWEKKYELVDQAIKFGADEIQLDYIRYASSQPPSEQNSENIYKVIKWFKTKLATQNIPLEIDVFGISLFRDSVYIGQSLTLFYDAVDAMCPMVYPSHFEPYQKYAKMPYYAIRSALVAMHKQFYGNIPFKVYPFIELYNYRSPLSAQEKVKYIQAEIKAVEDSNVDGFYVWNPHNKYDILFSILKNQQIAENNNE